MDAKRIFAGSDPTMTNFLLVHVSKVVQIQYKHAGISLWLRKFFKAVFIDSDWLVVSKGRFTQCSLRIQEPMLRMSQSSKKKV